MVDYDGQEIGKLRAALEEISSDIKPELCASELELMSEDSLRGLDRAIANWPAEFRAIMWDAVVLIATQRADLARRS